MYTPREELFATSGVLQLKQEFPNRDVERILEGVNRKAQIDHVISPIALARSWLATAERNGTYRRKSAFGPNPGSPEGMFRRDGSWSPGGVEGDHEVGIYVEITAAAHRCGVSISLLATALYGKFGKCEAFPNVLDWQASMAGEPVEASSEAERCIVLGIRVPKPASAQLWHRDDPQAPQAPPF